MNRAEASKLNRELYRYEGTAVTRRLTDDTFLVTVAIRHNQLGGVLGRGLSRDHIVAQALAWRNLKRKIFIA